MADPRGLWDPALVPAEWFDDAATDLGWFDPDLTQNTSPNGSTSVPKVTASVVVRTVTAVGDPVISRDTGASFPILASATGTVQVVTAAAFTPSASGTLVVVTVSGENFVGNNFGGNTVSWSGGTPTGASAFTKRSEIIIGLGNCFAQVWTASGPNSGVSGTVTSTTGSSSTQGAISLMVDALVSASTTMGVQNTASANSVTLTGVTAGSWLYVGNGDEGAALSPVANTTEIQEIIDASSARGAVGVNTTKTSGNISVGWGSGGAGNVAAAQEIKVSAAANPNGSTSAPKVTASIVNRSVSASGAATTSVPKVTVSIVNRTVSALGGAATSTSKVAISTVSRSVTGVGAATTSAPKVTAAVVARTVTGVAGGGSLNASTSAPSVSSSVVIRTTTGSGGATTSVSTATVSITTRTVTALATRNVSTSAPKVTVSIVVRTVTASTGGITPPVTPSRWRPVRSRTGTFTPWWRRNVMRGPRRS